MVLTWERGVRLQHLKILPMFLSHAVWSVSLLSLSGGSTPSQRQHWLQNPCQRLYLGRTVKRSRLGHCQQEQNHLLDTEFGFGCACLPKLSNDLQPNILKKLRLLTGRASIIAM
ncbi:uncharacterized protein BT62DRAFT_925968 [Guyanagaster necrorhizus]|uniref:Secreted protein n=1 Tax=Guyanagaster necrorhizus TaxID=856835 RepID=A0A9P7W342_9AGAR|nr:uncharacterized protein BT62DRAFT_925968 [Guyanagaster necrorhizus MCA 3950]KAG7451783.1 hypothetical protein BT62DRAFT_925968 [Guyanagaster necrorhizus MCA 3950]